MHTSRNHRLRLSGNRPICRKQIEITNAASVASTVSGASAVQWTSGVRTSHADAPAAISAIAPVKRMRDGLGGRAPGFF